MLFVGLGCSFWNSFLNSFLSSSIFRFLLASFRQLTEQNFCSLPVGNGRLLPAGPLRESWPRAVDLLIHTSQRSMAMGYGSSRELASEAVDASGAVKPLQDLQSHAVNAVAAIAQPHLFFDMLQAQGLRLGQTFALPDHANFEDWTPPDGNTPLLCTEKDAVKLWPRHPHVWAVPLEFTPEAAFWTALEALIQGRHKL